MKFEEAKSIIHSIGKNLIKENFSVSNVDQFVSCWGPEVWVFAGGEKPDNEFGLARNPCVLTTDGKWLGYSYYDAKYEKKLPAIFLTANESLVELLNDRPYHPIDGLIAYNCVIVPSRKCLEAFATQIEESIGYDEYFKRCEDLEKKIFNSIGSSGKKTRVAWF